jgi:hypothetical protein
MQRPLYQFWNELFTSVELEFAFVDSVTGGAYVSRRTFFTVYDFDRAMAGNGNGSTEVVQFGPEPIPIIRHPGSQVAVYPWGDAAFSQIEGATPAGVEAGRQALAGWNTDVAVATQVGVGADNPSDAYEGSELEMQRSLMVRLDNVSSFRLRFAIAQCCTTGKPAAQPRRCAAESLRSRTRYGSVAHDATCAVRRT